MFCHAAIGISFRKDAEGRLFSDGDREQLALVGVGRVYQVEVADAHRADTARLMFGRCEVPEDAVRREGVAYLSRQAVERALWEFLSDGHRLDQERTALLRGLRLDLCHPYEVCYDAEKRLYVFLSVAAAGTPVTAPLTAVGPTV